MRVVRFELATRARSTALAILTLRAKSACHRAPWLDWTKQQMTQICQPFVSSWLSVYL